MKWPLLINDKSKLNNFDIIRFLLAASVILCHSYVIFYGNEIFLTKEPFLVWSQQQISIGSVAVDLFFIISGFLIVKSFEYSTNTYNFLIKRVLRIYPGFIVAYLFSILIAGFFGSNLPLNAEGYRQYTENLYIKKEFVHLLSLQPIYEWQFFKESPVPGVNDALWTIQYEFICYLLVPLFAWLGFFRRKVWIIIAFITSYLLLLIQQKGYIFQYSVDNIILLNNPFFYPRFSLYFLSGVCFYVYRNYIIRSNLLALLAVVALVLSFTWIKCVDQVIPIAGSYLLFFFTFHPGIRFSNFARYGDFSYGVYLYGWPVQALVMHYLKDYITPASFFCIALPLSVVAAFFSWHLVEKRFLALRKKMSSPSKMT